MLIIKIMLFTCSILLGLGCSIGYKLGANRKQKTVDIPFVLAFEPLILASIFGVLAGILDWNTELGVILPALLSGFSTFVAMFCLFKSMGEGSFGVTVVLANMSFVVPILLSFIILKESASILQICGIFVMIAAIVIVNIKKGEIGEKKKGGWSILWALAACLFNGLINFGLKLCQFYTEGEAVLSFNFFTFLFCSVFAFIYLIGIKVKTKEGFIPSKSIFISLFLLVFCCGTNFYIQSLLPRYVNASVQFTIAIGGGMLAGILFSHLFYKEKFTWRSLVTVVGSTAAIVLQVL